MQNNWVSGTGIQTWSGKRLDFSAADPDAICIEDIAHALSLLCRYTGHCLQFYSVAEHSVHLARLPGTVRWKRTALLHDASEAYTGDISRPLKQLLPDFKRIELELEEIIAKKFDLVWPHPQSIKEFDTRILADEKARVMRDSDVWSMENVKPLGVMIECWGPGRARTEFLKTWRALS